MIQFLCLVPSYLTTWNAGKRYGKSVCFQLFIVNLKHHLGKKIKMDDLLFFLQMEGVFPQESVEI